MIVIADTVPLIHLILIERDTLLKGLYGRIMLPQAVAAELQAPAVPAKVKAWISDPLDWLEINKTVFRDDPGLAQLDAGQREVILLAQSLKADVLLMDDFGGRQEAGRRNLNVIGTLTVLYLGAGCGLVEDFPGTLNQLAKTGFLTTPALIQLFLDRHAERTKAARRR